MKLTHWLRGDKRVYAFHKRINSKENVIAQQELELTHNDVTVQNVSHDTTGFPREQFVCTRNVCKLANVLTTFI